jgi:hypothetical protein
MAYYKDNCLIYLSEKNRTDYFLREKGPKEERVQFNIIFREPNNPIKSEDDELSLNDWFKEPETAPP